MSLTPTNHAHGVIHVIVDATGNNSLHTFLILFTDLIGGCLAWDSRSRLHLIFWSFFSLYCIPLFVLIETNKDKKKTAFWQVAGEEWGENEKDWVEKFRKRKWQLFFVQL